jgi:hypothetical protein
MQRTQHCLPFNLTFLCIMSERVVFHAYMRCSRTMHVPDPWYRQLEYVINITDQGPSSLPGTKPPLDRSWDVRVAVRHRVNPNEIGRSEESLLRLVVSAVQVVQYCSMQAEPFASHNNSRLTLSKVSLSSWEVKDFVQRPNDYINISIQRYFSPTPEEIEIVVV